MKIDRLRGKQSASVHEATAWLNIWEGSVRSSKTICSLIRWAKFVRQGPAGNLAMVGKTERTLKRNVIDPLIEIFGPTRVRYNSGTGELFMFGRRIYVAGANDERAQEKIRGLTLAGAYVDEISVMPESMWSMLLTRLSIEGAQLFGTSNPDSPNHWLMRDYLKRAKVWIRHDGRVVRSDKADALDLARFSFRLADNPTLSHTYIANLEASFTGLWRLRFIEGRWVLAEGAIYDMFVDPDVAAVVQALPDIRSWFLSIDYGTSNPFVACLIGEGIDDRLYVAREWRWDSKVQGRQLTDGDYSEKLRTWLDELAVIETRPGYRPFAACRDPEGIYVDPSAASFIRQLHVDKWAGVRPADNTVADGIRTTSTLIATGRLKVHESCEGGVDEMAGYVWDPKAQEVGEDKPVKSDDHFPDALRYGVMGTRRVWRYWVPEDLAEAA